MDTFNKAKRSSIMGAVNIIYRSEIKKADQPEEMREQLVSAVIGDDISNV